MTLYQDAAAGSLTPKGLKRYGSQDINEIDATSGLTPLIAAINGGHVKVVELLLSNGADPDKPSRDHRTPLFWTTWKRGAENRSEIVSLLITAKAEVDETYPEVQNITPLMNAVDKLRDPEVVSQLVDANASTTATDRRGRSAKDLADKFGNPRLIKALRPKLDRYGPTAETVNQLVGFVLFIFAFINNKFLEGVVQGIAKRVFNITGENNPILEDAINRGSEPKTAEDFQDKINDWLVEGGLGRFFKSDDNYLSTLAEKAAQLQADKPTYLSEPGDTEKLVKLSLFKTMIYCDDSGSMGKPSNERSGAHSQLQLVKRMARICTTIVPDNEGVDLFYIHHDGVLNKREAEIEEHMKKVSGGSGTPIGTNLQRKILNPFVYSVMEGKNKQFQRPLFITIITDGCPTQELNGNQKALEEAVLNCIRKLKENGYPEYAVVFQVSRIGNDEDAKDFLKELNRQRGVMGLKSLYCTSDPLDKDLKTEEETELTRRLFKLLTAPVVGALP
ncbi:MAG: hypothetical protein Q9163_001522 [Psora crenata]